MTRDAMYDNTTELNGGRAMNETLWDQLANMVKDAIESKRPWVWLRKEDSSLTVTSATAYTTQFSLPTDFRGWVQPNPTKHRYAVRLVSGTTVIGLIEAPYDRRHELQNTSGYFFCDYPNSKIYFSGTASQTYTVYLNYLKRSPDIADSADWVFPSNYHMIIPLLVTGANKGGIDYDSINREMAPDNRAVAESIMTAMCFWDEGLQRIIIGI